MTGYIDACDVQPGMVVRNPYGVRVPLRVVELLGPRPADGALQFRVAVGGQYTQLRTAVFRPRSLLILRDEDQPPAPGERACANCGTSLPVHCVHHLLPCCPGRCPGPGGFRTRLTDRWAGR